MPCAVLLAERHFPRQRFQLLSFVETPLPTAASRLNALSHCIGLLSARMLSGERRGMNLNGSLALLGISLALLFFGRGRDGDALPFLQKGIAAYMFAIVVFALFVAGVEGTAVNLGWLR